MVATSLQDDLLAIPGVEGAEVDGSQDAPAGLRIRIAEGADQEAVGGAIRRVLSSHGLGTDTKLPGELTETAATDLEESTVAVITDSDQIGQLDVDQSIADAQSSPDAVIDLTDNATEVPPVALDDEDKEPELIEASIKPGSWVEGELPPFIEQRSSEPSEDDASSIVTDEASTTTDDEKEQPESAPGVARVESVAVVEGRSGIVVSVRATDGHETSQPASSSEGGVEAAVVKAAARLIDESSPDPIVVEIEDRRVEGVDLVLIILDINGELVTGSAIVAAGRAFALGRATWAALAL